ncbi:hypothetical protein HHL11_01125 [Ramlibacter sp. G-1-2-2]|uniref:Uncharacterized protein n=1 Tax=Ramlibacter agri TaxID=2728837 RepID=A0A848GY46_9BURK|nr:hypothetical protein [Ramlibacter agri]NML42331.1 hypothetical protein [Ramlibacter agri]
MTRKKPAPSTGTITLYRAVEEPERASIMATGKFSWGPLPTFMKQFGRDLEEVRAFAAANSDCTAIVEVVVASHAARGAHFSTNIDAHIFRSGVYTFNQLDILNGAIQSLRWY